MIRTIIKHTLVLIAASALLTLALPGRAEFSHEFLDSQPETVSRINGIYLNYRIVGAEENPPVLMIMGLGASHLVWGDDMVTSLVDAGYRVVLFDNRDTGGTQRFDEFGQPVMWWNLTKNYFGLSVTTAYTLSDMAADAVGLLDELSISDAHIIGASLGGMIAQRMAARYPERSRSLVSMVRKIPCYRPSTANTLPRLFRVLSW